MAESRRKLRQVADMAHGVYLRAETNKGDSWRDVDRHIILAKILLKLDELVNKQNIKSVLDTINWLEMYGAKLVEKENGSI